MPAADYDLERFEYRCPRCGLRLNVVGIVARRRCPECDMKIRPSEITRQNQTWTRKFSIFILNVFAYVWHRTNAWQRLVLVILSGMLLVAFLILILILKFH